MSHIPVLLSEVLTSLAPQGGETYVDGTFGEGGYSRALLQSAPCQVVAIDQDPRAVAMGRLLEQEYPGRFRIIEGRFGDMARLIEGSVQGVVLDIGVSSPQLDEAERGFSFQKDGPLDMRMGASGQTAADLVNTLDETQLAHLIWVFGEERKSRFIARALVKRRDEKPFERTLDLADVIRSVVRRGKSPLDPATRTFQALRIAVNDELGELERGLQGAQDILAPGGRLVVVTFHSLEDRIVKNFFKEAGERANPSRHQPLLDDVHEATFVCPFRKAVQASDREIQQNPRSRSAKLRLGIRTSVKKEIS